MAQKGSSQRSTSTRLSSFARSLRFPYIEKANGLVLMYGDDSEDEIRELLETAVSMTPGDAMQALDIGQAEAQLGDL